MVSVALHAAIAAVLFVRLPELHATPAPEESISVELVSPPPDGPAVVPPPEEKPEQEAKADEAPPPPEEPQPADPPAEKVPLPVLRPVLEFGEKDTGSRIDDSDLTRGAAQPKEQPSETAAAASQPLETTALDKQQERELPDASEQPASALAEEEEGELPGAADGAQASDAGAAPLEEAAKHEDAKKSDVHEAQLTEAKRIFSTSVTDDPVARTAMGDLPRGSRVEQLCSTELFAQLRHASPPHSPELLPSFRLSRGTVLDIRRAAFRAKSRWYDLSFRCEVDADATRVVSFAFDVGAEIPRSQWRERGFPAL